MIGQQARYYFTDLLGDASRVGPIGTSFNQSWRGGISRILGHDAGYGPLVLARDRGDARCWRVLAWRAGLGGRDRLGSLLVVQLFGLLISPISWTHHWVWLRAVDDLAAPRTLAAAAAVRGCWAGAGWR